MTPRKQAILQLCRDLQAIVAKTLNGSKQSRQSLRMHKESHNCAGNIQAIAQINLQIKGKFTGKNRKISIFSKIIVEISSINWKFKKGKSSNNRKSELNPRNLFWGRKKFRKYVDFSGI